jgi:tetratricopeptide (TPR) repeat protein
MASAGHKARPPCALRNKKGASLLFLWARSSTTSLACVLALTAIILSSATPTRAQAGTVNPEGGHGPALQTAQPGFAQAALSPTMPTDYSRLIEAEACESWTAVAVDSPTVSVARLAVPGKARDEFQKACKNLKHDNFATAEEHARRALEIYPDYAAAWVVLGQALTAGNKENEGAQACKQAMKVDPTYAPPYICLAQFAGRTNHWDDVYTFSDHAQSLDPLGDPYVYFYKAMADLHLKRYAQAEREARYAEQLDDSNDIPKLHLLLAQLYQTEGNRAGETVELQKFLELSPHDSDWQAARSTLAELQNSVTK